MLLLSSSLFCILCTDLVSGIYTVPPQGGDPGLREGRACTMSTET